MRIAMTLLALAVALGPGCKKKEGEPAAGSAVASGAGSAEGSAMAGSGGSAMAGSSAGSAMAGSAMAGSAMAGSGAGSGANAADTMAHHAGNCPSTVLNSTTKAELKGKDVVVTVTSDDKDAISAIQKRADELLAGRKEHKTPTTGHDQKGEHGGDQGLCPVYVPEGASAKAKHEKNGVVVTITPKDKPDALKTDIDGRIQKAADWVKANIQPGHDKNQGGTGGGANNEGMNHSGKGDGKGKERKGSGSGGGTGGGGGKGTGGGKGK